jgi:hypothetical protein
MLLSSDFLPAAYRNLVFLARHRHQRRMQGAAGVAREDATVLGSRCSMESVMTR